MGLNIGTCLLAHSVAGGASGATIDERADEAIRRFASVFGAPLQDKFKAKLLASPDYPFLV